MQDPADRADPRWTLSSPCVRGKNRIAPLPRDQLMAVSAREASEVSEMAGSPWPEGLPRSHSGATQEGPEPRRPPGGRGGWCDGAGVRPRLRSGRGRVRGFRAPRFPARLPTGSAARSRAPPTGAGAVAHGCREPPLRRPAVPSVAAGSGRRRKTALPARRPAVVVAAVRCLSASADPSALDRAVAYPTDGPVAALAAERIREDSPPAGSARSGSGLPRAGQARHRPRPVVGACRQRAAPGTRLPPGALLGRRYGRRRHRALGRRARRLRHAPPVQPLPPSRT